MGQKFLEGNKLMQMVNKIQVQVKKKKKDFHKFERKRVLVTS